MPQAVMDSPIGRMLLPQLTQGVNANRQNGSILGLGQNTPATSSAASVRVITHSSQFTQAMSDAKPTAAVIFFTSATCPPCKTLYPLYDELAQELHGKAVLIKVDVSNPAVADIAQRYSISATPTFVTYLKGEQLERWSGADPAKLRGNARLLVEMVSPKHLHDTLGLPTFQKQNTPPSLYTKIPPLQKLVAKMDGSLAKSAQTQALISFIETREKSPQDAVLPSLQSLAEFLQSSASSVQPQMLFGLVDLFRCALVDPRVSGYFAEDSDGKTITALIHVVNSTGECPYALRLLTLQMACNMFSTPLFTDSLMKSDSLRQHFTALISSSFLDDSHSNTRVAAASLLFNLSLSHRKARHKNPGSGLPEEDQVELAASVVEAIGQEQESSEALHGMLLALGHLFYGTDLESELADLLRALAADNTIASKRKAFPNEALIQEVGTELLEKGLRKP